MQKDIDTLEFTHTTHDTLVQLCLSSKHWFDWEEQEEREENLKFSPSIGTLECAISIKTKRNETRRASKKRIRFTYLFICLYVQMHNWRSA